MSLVRCPRCKCHRGGCDASSRYVMLLPVPAITTVSALSFQRGRHSPRMRRFRLAPSERQRRCGSHAWFYAARALAPVADAVTLLDAALTVVAFVLAAACLPTLRKTLAVQRGRLLWIFYSRVHLATSNRLSYCQLNDTTTACRATLTRPLTWRVACRLFTATHHRGRTIH